MSAADVKVQFNAHLKPVNRSKRRYRALRGSAGSGKSVNIAQDYILKLGDPKYAGANLLCVRKVNETNRNSTFAELTGAINRIFGERTDEYWEVLRSPLTIRSRVTGNEVIFRGMNDVRDREKVKSINFAHGKLVWVWVEEATELQESDVDNNKSVSRNTRISLRPIG
ncbi:phage terminase, large subunit, PBSX family [Actinobacillus pleuropneumoniae]|nr:phage terminase, large subunit, PBSX family [Actinobacillus pleuropneumoniae]